MARRNKSRKHQAAHQSQHKEDKPKPFNFALDRKDRWFGVVILIGAVLASGLISDGLTLLGIVAVYLTIYIALLDVFRHENNPNRWYHFAALSFLMLAGCAVWAWRDIKRNKGPEVNRPTLSETKPEASPSFSPSPLLSPPIPTPSPSRPVIIPTPKLTPTPSHQSDLAVGDAPFIAVTSYALVGDINTKDPVKVRITYRNTGKTTAIHAHFDCSLLLMAGEFPIPPPDIPMTGRLSDTPLGSNVSVASFPVSQRPLTGQELQDLKEGRLRLYVFGTVTYNDMLGTGATYIVHFCAYYEPSLNAFTLYDKYNDMIRK